MKNSFNIILSILFFGLFTSCSKDSESPSASLAAGKCSISFNYSGKASGSYASIESNSSNQKLNGFGIIMGNKNNNEASLLQPYPQLGTISYNKLINGSDMNSFSFVYNNRSYGASAGSDFTTVVTKNDGTVVELTFSGRLTNNSDTSTFLITNGKLAAKY